MAGEGIAQGVLVNKTTMDPSMGTMQLAFFKSDGTPHVVPAQAAAQTDVAALTATAAAGANPTDAEFDALLADVTALRTVVNSLLAKLRTAGVISA